VYTLSQKVDRFYRIYTITTKMWLNLYILLLINLERNCRGSWI